MSPNTKTVLTLMSVGSDHLWLIEDPALNILEMLRYNWIIHVSNMF